ncbi:hypothetical protein DAETH_45470 (plasmid) [Deinococcus aetherius]|uniref:Uncharacterized protein n=1 Tax=Deinococcus aetherius TaxID=200252 RepID=A0ABM8AL69_9DEIO|nr:hypothetical protein DAETH_45470 [Deinococcus aetherius]
MPDGGEFRREAEQAQQAEDDEGAAQGEDMSHGFSWGKAARSGFTAPVPNRGGARRAAALAQGFCGGPHRGWTSARLPVGAGSVGRA